MAAPPWVCLLAGFVLAGCGSTGPVEPVRSVETGRRAADLEGRLAEVHREQADLAAELAGVLERLEALEAGQREVALAVAGLRRGPASDAAAGRLDELEHRVEGLEAGRRALIEVLEKRLERAPSVARSGR